jgi:hypothetical protein
LASRLHRALAGFSVELPAGPTSYGQLLEGFAAHCVHETGVRLAPAEQTIAASAAWTFLSTNRLHAMLVRPYPLWVPAHPDSFVALLGRLPDIVPKDLLERFAGEPAVRARAAVYDLERGEKINLTRSDVFVHFERFLRRTHRLRVVPSPDVTRALADSGVLTLDKG